MKFRDTLSSGFFGLDHFTLQRHGAFSPDTHAAAMTSSITLKACLDLHAHHGAGRRRVRDGLPVQPIQHVVFDTVADHRVDLDETIQRRAGGLELKFQILKDPPGLAGDGAVLALAGIRVDRHHP